MRQLSVPAAEIRRVPAARILMYLSSEAGINRRCPLNNLLKPSPPLLLQSEESFRTDRRPEWRWNRSRTVLLGRRRRNRWVKGQTMSLHVLLYTDYSWYHAHATVGRIAQTQSGCGDSHQYAVDLFLDKNAGQKKKYGPISTIQLTTDSSRQCVRHTHHTQRPSPEWKVLFERSSHPPRR